MDAITAMPEAFSASDVIRWFAEFYPRVRATTVRAHLVAATVNDSSRVHFNFRAGDILFKTSRGRFERYDPARHGWWSTGHQVMAATDEASDSVDSDEASERGESLQDLIGEALLQVRGIQLNPAVVQLRGDVTHRFDLVSEDQATVGTWADQDPSVSPAVLWPTISETDWLLQNFARTGSRFVLFARNRSVPLTWLGQLAQLAQGVEFFFLDQNHLIDLKEQSSHGAA